MGAFSLPYSENDLTVVIGLNDVCVSICLSVCLFMFPMQ